MSHRTPFLPAPGHRLRLAELGVLDRRRTLVGLVIAVVLPLAVQPAALWLVGEDRSGRGLVTVVLFQMLATVVVALVGGLWPAVLAAVVANLALNWFATEPFGSLSVARPEAALGLVVFLVVACTIALAVGAAARRFEQATRAAAEAGAMSDLALGILGSTGGMDEFLERVRSALGLRAVALISRGVAGGTRGADGGERDDGVGGAGRSGSPGRTGHGRALADAARTVSGWDVVATAGEAPPISHAAADDAVAPDGYYTLLVGGHSLDDGERRTLKAFGVYLVAMRERAQLARSREANRRLEEGNSIRTAILQAVSHDLRTPLAGIKLSVSSLRQSSVDFTPEEEAELLGTIEDYTDRLSHVVDNLLDMSRISADNVRPLLRPVAWREVVSRGVAGQERVVDLIPANAPAVEADPVLLERVVANLVENALRYAPEAPVEITSRSGVEDADGRPCGVLRVVDHGEGIPPEDLLLVFRPFQRLGDDTAKGGVGLGLAVAKGFVEAMGGRIEAEETPGGGLTMSVALPLAPGVPPGRAVSSGPETRGTSA
ncbi:ATP-binding protein [Sinomonas sp. ASV486]|uniref:sensor histidine kinase n=1 Tax=Sinomonas sp. ASV486 TaxID=3051170 RepID=UPI0027DB4B2B|nr:ATP-binding protein [Sinomonas sp. ASV486]MDQ4488679.1 ATP-binding protein [Sinomonas sp. ASV486]